MSLFTKELINSCTTLIFDLDGTILDSMKVWGEVDEIFLSKRSLKVTPEYVEGIKCRSIYQGALFTIELFGLDETPEAVVEEWENLVADKYSNEILLKEGVKDFLFYAKSKGLKICLATASSRKNSANALRNNGVLELFDHLLTLDDFEGEINKHNPDIFLKAMNLTGETDTSKCIVFEDVLGAIEGANKAGFKTVIVFDELSQKAYDEATHIADFEIKNWKNV